MNTRITVDLGNPQLLTLLKMEAAGSNQSLKEIIVQALESYFSSKRENKALVKLAENAFSEWDNSKDSAYDDL